MAPSSRLQGIILAKSKQEFEAADHLYVHSQNQREVNACVLVLNVVSPLSYSSGPPA